MPLQFVEKEKISIEASKQSFRRSLLLAFFQKAWQGQGAAAPKLVNVSHYFKIGFIDSQKQHSLTMPLLCYIFTKKYVIIAIKPIITNGVDAKSRSA